MEADVFLQILKVYSILSYFQSSKIGDLCFMKCPSERLPTFVTNIAYSVHGRYFKDMFSNTDTLNF